MLTNLIRTPQQLQQSHHRRLFSTQGDIQQSQQDGSTAIRRSKQAAIGNVNPDGKTKRWFKKTGIQQYKLADEEGYAILLDDRIIKTPADNRMWVPSRRLALALAAEWDTQEEFIVPRQMPLTTLAATTLDIIPIKRAMVVDNLLSYLRTDVTCVRDRHPIVAGRQRDQFVPILRWFSEEFKVPPPAVFVGTQVIQQPEELMGAIQWMLFQLDDFTLTGLDTAALNLKSFVLATALWKDRISVQDAITGSRLEELWQQGNWGEVEGEHDVEKYAIHTKVASASLWLKLLPKST
eukprot:TRINITY_DN424_c1_g1_i1.p1 TRINITY_DN424_c1_g1~~TRINITY_DN424_c1_g1_i1.p1  ORF type:complete len:293 (+),score=76.65 TRINITY_DN424_c1_g1_i1:35-913(+)